MSEKQPIKEKSFWALLTEDNFKIEIPTIQRDYVQGSRAAKDKGIPQKFIADIYEALKTNTKLSLEFVYGNTTADKKLHLLDGQQRLTTLFLVHYYLFLATCPHKKENEYGKTFQARKDTWQKERAPLGNFCYATRSNTRDFCIQLLSNKNLPLSLTNAPTKKLPVDTHNEKGNEIFPNLSAKIIDEPWFNFPKDDPTVSSMLNMLDIIQQKFSAEEQECYGFLNKLKGPVAQCPIVFNFLNMQELKLGDELYLKMNARGKPLTDYEIFKSKLTEWLPKEEKILSSPTSQNTAEFKLDNDWQQIFWNKAVVLEDTLEEKYKKGYICRMDMMQFRFFEQIALLLFLQQPSSLGNSTQTESVENILENFQLLKQAPGLFGAQERPENLKALLHVLEGFHDFNNHQDKANTIHKKISEALDNIITKDLSYKARLQLFVLFLFWKEEKNRTNMNILAQWFRVCYNLISNTNIDEAGEFKKALSSLQKLYDGYKQSAKSNFYEFLSSDNPNIEAFDQNQVKEEKEKSRIIQQKALGENVLLEAESHAYFDGKIGFILNFSKDSAGNYNQANFQSYYAKLSRLFDKKLENVFQRALLAFGKSSNIKYNYLPLKGNGYTFCPIDSAIRTKKDTWHKVFDDTNKTNLLKGFLDSLPNDFSYDTLEKFCTDFCTKLDNKYNTFNRIMHPAYCTDWRYLFVKNEYKLLSNYREIRYASPNSVIFNKTSGRTKWQKQGELYTYAFYQYIVRNKYNWNCHYEWGHKQFSIDFEDHSYRLSYNNSCFMLTRYEKKEDNWVPTNRQWQLMLVQFPQLFYIINVLINND
ncbi:GmrSD restriction endonuclease domain-containing protein [Candidatus Avelusimicrobium faecicola]|uniref:DUF262 domain-containing protein n=1 Tax=Candidatus Avelusimicrobium faecicola TaxID=3416205 RepID=UPI0015A0532E